VVCPLPNDVSRNLRSPGRGGPYARSRWPASHTPGASRKAAQHALTAVNFPLFKRLLLATSMRQRLCRRWRWSSLILIFVNDKHALPSDSDNAIGRDRRRMRDLAARQGQFRLPVGLDLKARRLGRGGRNQRLSSRGAGGCIVSVRLHQSAYEHAQKMIRNGQCILYRRGDWTDHKPHGLRRTDLLRNTVARHSATRIWARMTRRSSRRQQAPLQIPIRRLPECSSLCSAVRGIARPPVRVHRYRACGCVPA
jgi:hypothetical protein